VQEILDQKTIAELLVLHSGILHELRRREVLRTANNPTGDLAEYLFCKAFGWAQESNSTKAFDAVDEDGLRYQIKGRRLHGLNRSRQLSAIRDLNGFDVLAAVLFDDNYLVMKAALIPAIVIRDRSKFVEHTNSNRFLLRDEIWSVAGVTDVSEQLRNVA
jgi:hypothetical protein